MKKLLFLVLGVAVMQIPIFSQVKRSNFTKNDLKAERSKHAVNVSNQHSNFVGNYSSPGAKGLLYQNGPFVTHPGGGPNGNNFSLLDTSVGLGSYGFAHSISNNYTVAEDFAVPAGGWTIDSMVFYCYQTGSGTTSTINNYHVQIWNGRPGEQGSTVIWGNLTTNRLSRTHFSGCYRGDNLTNSQRPIMRNVINTPGLTLQPGIYWVEWQAGGSLTSGPWANPVAIMGVAITGNALQKVNSSWNNLEDNNNPQGLPFEIYGTGTPSCIHPLFPVVSNVTANSVTISWSSISGNNWIVEYGPEGFTPGTGTIISTSTNTVDLSSLSPGTPYDVYIYTDCGGGATSSYVYTSFLTASCDVSDQCAYVLSFSDSYGDGWNGASISVYVNGYFSNSYTLADGSSGTANLMVCPNDSISLIFNSGYYDEECGFEFYDPFNNLIYSFTAGNSPTPNTPFFQFVGNCTPPSCATPTNLTVTNITPTTATLSWTPGGNETQWIVQYGPTGFAFGSGTFVTVTSNPTCTLTNLSEGGTYDWYVRAICGTGDTSYWSYPPNHFTTLCNPISVYPYVESFESSSFPPNCWTVVDVDGDGKNWELESAPGFPAYDGNQVAVSASWDYQTFQPLNPNNYLITPQFFIPNSNMILKFYAAPQDPDYPNEFLGVEVSTTNTQPSSFTSVYTTTLQAADSVWREIIIPLSNYNGQNIYIAFRHYNCTDMFYVKIDKVQVMQSTDINVTNIHSNIFVYPNPASTTLNIANEKAIRLEIYDLKGQLVANYSNVKVADISNLSAGTYMVRIVTNNETVSQKITIVK
jgi:hypothetical protein